MKILHFEDKEKDHNQFTNCLKNCRISEGDIVWAQGYDEAIEKYNTNSQEIGLIFTDLLIYPDHKNGQALSLRELERYVFKEGGIGFIREVRKQNKEVLIVANTYFWDNVGFERFIAELERYNVLLLPKYYVEEHLPIEIHQTGIQILDNLLQFSSYQVDREVLNLRLENLRQQLKMLALQQQIPHVPPAQLQDYLDGIFRVVQLVVVFSTPKEMDIDISACNMSWESLRNALQNEMLNRKIYLCRNRVCGKLEFDYSLTPKSLRQQSILVCIAYHSTPPTIPDLPATKLGEKEVKKKCFVHLDEEVREINYGIGNLDNRRIGGDVVAIREMLSAALTLIARELSEEEIPVEKVLPKGHYYFNGSLKVMLDDEFKKASFDVVEPEAS